MTKFRHDRLFFALILIAFLSAVLLYFQIFNSYNLRIGDFFYQRSSDFSSDIVVLGIDDESLQEFGRWPWDRGIYAEILEILKEGNAAAIGIDIIFTEQSEKESDRSFSEAIKNAGNVVLPVYCDMTQRMDASGKSDYYADNVYKPVDEIGEYAILSHINVLTDKDGILRRWIPYIRFDERLKRDANLKEGGIHAFAWSLYTEYMRNRGRDVLAFEQIPKNADESVNLMYSSLYDEEHQDINQIEHISLHKVLYGEVEPQYFEGKVVLIGPTAVGIPDDYYYTALANDRQTYGIDIHANIINQLIRQNFYEKMDVNIQFLILLVWGLISALIYSYNTDFSVFLKFIGILLLSIAGFYIFVREHIILDILYFMFLIIVQFISQIGMNYIYEKGEKRKIKRLFGKYMTPDLIDLMLDKNSDSEFKLGGEKREITVLFVDIRGFTTMSESVEPEEVVLILNDYLTLCAKSIFDYGGMLDKYIGDAAMGIYNAPFDLKAHSLMAVKSAWAMHKGSEDLNKRLFEKTGHTIQFGVGINTGFAIVGNIGADFRMDYTAIGDTVNTASRIESNSKAGQILISEAVYQQVKDYVQVLDLGTIKVKGKVNGVRVYQVIGLEE